MIRALIFDFDGLILDTEVPEFQAWQEVFQEHGCELSLSTWSGYIGSASHHFDPCSLLESQLGRSVDRDTVKSKRRQRNRELLSAQKVLPGVESYLTSAHRLSLKIGLASSSPRDWVSSHLTRLGLMSYFESIKTRDDVTEAKPNPELYLLVLSALGVQPGEAIALEDSPNGILAAKAAGMLCVAIPNQLTRQLSLDNADLQLNSLAELPLESLISKLEVRS